MPRLPHHRTHAAGTLALAVAATLSVSVCLPAADQPAPRTAQAAGESPLFTPSHDRGLAAAPSAPSAGPTAGSARTQSPAAATGLSQLPTGQDCPTGTSRVTTLLSEGFDKGVLPEPTYTKGWNIVSGSARTGSGSARSVIRASDASTQPNPEPYWPLGLPYVQAGAGRTILRYSIKGSYPADTAFVSVNAESGTAAPSPSWGTVTLDVTDAITPADDGYLDIRFANYPAARATDSTIELDDIEVYTCAAASDVRGDFDGDGIADVVTVDASGQLQVWPGTGDFHVKAPIVAGTGWSSVTWIGSSGDLNGDKRADLLARFSNGDLVVFYGDGAGRFTRGSLKVGIGWNGINSIVPMGDINGDGLPDFLARDAANNMRRYWLASQGGTLTGGTIVGTGFGDFTALFSMGDFDHDGRFDLTGILKNGDMRVYTTLASGALWGTGQKIGNGWAFRQATSPGDYNRDGIPDVLALDWSGNILTYPVLGDGRWGRTVVTGTGFGGFRLMI